MGGIIDIPGVTWRGIPNGQEGEANSNLSIDVAVPGEPTVITTIDGYVTGGYISRRGRVFRARMRFTIQVTYSSSTVALAMERAKREMERLFLDTFADKNFEVSEVFIPNLDPVRGRVSLFTEQFYRGTKLFKELQGARFLDARLREMRKRRNKRMRDMRTKRRFSTRR